MAKKQRVPEVLWRLYQNRARALAETVKSLLPPSPSSLECRCNGRRCLGCSGTESLSFLLRPDDPSDYKDLLTRCFVVVSTDAPPLSVFYPDRRWSQRQIVWRTIELIMCDSRRSANAICDGYDKFTHSSRVMDLLTTSAWSLLLMRIGDDFMVHLLKFTSIFLPLPRENHHQVAGVPISHLFPKFSKRSAESAYPQPLCVEPELSRKQSEMSFSEMNMLKTCTTLNTHKEKSNGVLQQSSNKATTKSRKRLRPFNWQRRRKRRQVNFEEDKGLTTCFSTKQYEENFTGKLQENSSTSLTYHHEKEPSYLESEKQHTICVQSKSVSL